MSRDDWPDDWDGPRTADEQVRRRLDDLFSLLANPRRRDLLYHLAATEVTDVETLVSNVAAAREGVPCDEVSSDIRKQVQIDLLHTHLPKLADAGAIEFDSRSGVIRCRAFPSMLGQLLETSRGIEAVE